MTLILFTFLQPHVTYNMAVLTVVVAGPQYKFLTKKLKKG